MQTKTTNAEIKIIRSNVILIIHPRRCDTITNTHPENKTVAMDETMMRHLFSDITIIISSLVVLNNFIQTIFFDEFIDFFIGILQQNAFVQSILSDCINFTIIHNHIDIFFLLILIVSNNRKNAFMLKNPIQYSLNCAWVIVEELE